MPEQRYRLRFLPLFEDDLNRIVDYIAVDLRNPLAADNFVGEVQQAIHKRATCAEAFAQYPSLRERQNPYYRIFDTGNGASANINRQGFQFSR